MYNVTLFFKFCSALANEKYYWFEIILFGIIIKENISYASKGLYFEIKMEKFIKGNGFLIYKFPLPSLYFLNVFILLLEIFALNDNIVYHMHDYNQLKIMNVLIILLKT